MVIFLTKLSVRGVSTLRVIAVTALGEVIEGMLFWPGVLGGGVDSRVGELVGVDGKERVQSEGL